MNVGVVGICGFGRFHAEAFVALGCNVVAAADRGDGLDEMAARFGAMPYRDYRHLLARDDLDAISVALPPALHPEVVRAAHGRGIAVFCEKPVGTSAAESDALLAALGPEARVMVGFSFRFHPAYLRLRELIGSGDLGRIRTVHARKCWGTNTPWRLRSGGGAVFVKDIHYYDLVPWLLGQEPTDLCAFGGSFYHDGEVEDSYQLLLDFAGGTTFHLDSAWWTLDDSVSRFEVIGERARVQVEEDALHVTGEGARIERPAGEPMVAAEIRAFVDWHVERGPRPPGLAEAARANRLAQRVRDAINARRRHPPRREDPARHD